MRKITITYLLFSILAIQSIAQDFTYPYKKMDVHINLWPLLDYNPRLRMGVEYHPSGQLGYNLDIGIGKGIMTEIVPAASIFRKDYSFYEIRPEIKYYFPGKVEHFKIYSSIELFGLTMHSVLEDTYYHKEEPHVCVDFDQADLNKFKCGAHFKTGIRTLNLERVSFDLYVGYGFAYRSFNYSNIVNAVTSQYEYWEEWIPQNFRYEGGRIIFHMTAGFKMGILIF